MKRRAVSIVELSIGIALLAFLAAQISLSMTLTTHTPKHEAERLAKKLSSLMLKADKTQTHFQIEIEPDKMYIQWNTSETSIVKQAETNSRRHFLRVPAVVTNGMPPTKSSTTPTSRISSLKEQP